MRVGAVVLGAMLFVAGLAAGLVLTGNLGAPTERVADVAIPPTTSRPASLDGGNPPPSATPTRTPGGATVLNARGELVGINTAIYSDSGGYQGVGFAVPSNLARRVMLDLIDFGEVRRGALGYVDVQPLTPQLARELGAPDTSGVVVWRIDSRSAAAQAGIEPGDIIVMFDRQLVEDPSDYARLLSDAEIGSTVTLGIIRAGQRYAFDVAVSQAPSR